MTTALEPIVFKIVTYSHLDPRLIGQNCPICREPFALYPNLDLTAKAITYHTAPGADNPLHAFHLDCAKLGLQKLVN